jgi:hypothetical protein
MKTPISATHPEDDMNTFHKKSPVSIGLYVAMAAFLTACGGGGGGGASTTAAVVTTPVVTTPVVVVTPTATAFKAVVPQAGFNWTTVQKPATGITLSRVSGQALGTRIKLNIANFTCVHSAVGSLVNPMATDTLTAYPLTATEGANKTLTVSLGAVQIPAAITQVLVEVLDGNSTLYSKRHAVSALGSLTVAFPDTTPSSQDPTYVDQCP